MRRFAILTALPLLVLTAGSLAEDAPRSITTSGDATVYVAPDEVVVNFGVETFDPDLDKAKALNDDASGRLLKAIKGLNIDPKHIQTDTLQIDIQYRSNRPWEGIQGYFARRMYSVRLKDVKMFEKLVDTGLKNGANQLAGFDFRTTELRKYRDQARRMAIQAAKQKAVALAKELDCGVGKPRTITEGYGGYFGAYTWRFNQYNNMAQNSVQEAPAAGAGEEQGETLPLGQIGVKAQVNVTFDLSDHPAPDQKPPMHGE